MELGAFSISLTVKDLGVSRAFYEKLGFEHTGGGDEEHYMIMRNSEGATIGLFHGMFDKNILSFNPGLTQAMDRPAHFTDVREIRARLLEAGIELTADTDPEGTGPAHITCLDPDGNTVLIDQFFPKPGSEKG